MKHSKKLRWLATSLMIVIPSANAAWFGILGIEGAKTVRSDSKHDTFQTETILQGAGLDLGGLTVDNITAAKWNKDGKITVARNWSYGYWNDHHGLSLDLIKGDFLGAGPSIGSIGYAYKDCWDNFCLRVNPAIAYLSNKSATTGSRVEDQGFQLNTKMDYRVTDRLSFGFHPQYAGWLSDENGGTLKLDFNVGLDITGSGDHKLMLVHERFAVNNRSTGMKTRFVGEGDPIAGYVAGTESTVKLRYVYKF
ncbi:hypothetical protein VITU102760_04045 [Vibrio tubiashii]|uniref:Outer membrane protein beta-barrel domain-containing protein n=1 Tax=Vibrio tubiashii ATCC 19109 TaxID=1051646 RepID=F9T514_9VIBR|nr:hypothetical protein [Vibrio tubiashii]AIW16714.1 hypothetical protein IX91_21785 [Vibrio tubiashii ATCC 19109]EGU55501.1 hypothetical protein VITU9109_07598 [Vibrio tubiashii ATCC 19109]EIF02060.1 hypothetical protein VT1337_20052 [Vibrio tubiashii NCIMB 1337 = ATCC 19106]